MVSPVLFGLGFRIMVRAAEESGVDGVGHATVLPFGDVIDLAPSGGCTAPGNSAASVSIDDGFSGGSGEEALRSAKVDLA